MPSSRAWQCPVCERFFVKGTIISHGYSPPDEAAYERCPGVPVEGVWTPIAETRKGWLDDNYASGNWSVSRHKYKGDVPVLVVPMPEEMK